MHIAVPVLGGEVALRRQLSIVATYLFLLLNRLEFSESFHTQVRAVQGLAAVLAELGDEEAEKLLDEAVKFEAEAHVLDVALAEMREEILHGNLAGLDPELRARVARLRRALERFKAKLLVALDEKLRGKVPVFFAGGGERAAG